ncbi:hypothetical protein GJAV_G00135270 [Gymnothorax javanicus]|nr:hypothetical protein GJAV_G00135270 [Gymnothorax javanicus]
MPRKKRTRRKDTDDDDAFPSKRGRTDNDELLVISDSDTEEVEYKQTARETRLRGRESRAQQRELTEDEMLELAVKLSEKEAGNAALRQQQEEEEMRLAIAQSLHANGELANSGDCELLPLVMTPVGGSQPLADQSPTPGSESPVFPPRQKPAFLSLNKRKEQQLEDLYTTATAVGVADPHSQSPAPLESLPVTAETPAQALPVVDSSQGIFISSDSDRESQGSSAVSTSQARGRSPVFPRCSPLRPVLCVEKLNLSQEQECHSAGFVRCLPKVTWEMPSKNSTSSVCLTAEPPGSPVFSGLERRENWQHTEGARNFPEKVTGTELIPLTDEGTSENLVRGEGSSLESQGFPEETHKSTLVPSDLRASCLEHVHQDGNRNHLDSSQVLNQEQLCQGTIDATHSPSATGRSLSERNAGGALMGVLQPEHDFPTQMTLHWSDGDDEEDAAKEEECSIVPQTPSPEGSQSAVYEQSVYSDSESLLKRVPGSVRSPVFPREVVALKPSISRNPASPLRTPIPVSKAGVGGTRSVRRKLPCSDTYAANSPARPSNQEVPSSSSGQSIRASPALKVQTTPDKADQGAATVQYYWGVPFCPRGLRPDEYTQVILTQLEVYEKELKSARRGLLQKASWGEPVLSGTLSKRGVCRRSRLKRVRPARPLRSEEEEEEEEGEEVRDPGEAEEGERRGGLLKESESDGEDGRGGTQESGASGVPTVTLLEEKSPVGFVPEEPQEEFTQMLHERSPAESETQLLEVPGEEEEGQEEDDTCPETQLSEENTLDVNMESPVDSRPGPESEMEVEQEDVGGEEVQSLSPEAGGGVAEEAYMELEVSQPEVQGSGGDTVECPMCMRAFPGSQIEVHAAYCDGASEPSGPREESASQAMILRKSTRRTEPADENLPGSSKPSKATHREKCYLCQGLFPAREYQSHVEDCLRQKSSNTNQGTKGLLTALERSEQQNSEAGPSRSSFRKNQHSRSGAAEASGGAAYAVSDSPIKSFTPISEAPDCLVDFKRQFSAKPTQKLSRKRKFADSFF